MGAPIATRIDVDGSRQITFDGVVSGLPSTNGWMGEWHLGARTVQINADTRFDQTLGAIMVGAHVAGTATEQTGRPTVASEIHVTQPAVLEFTAVVVSLPDSSDLMGTWTVGDHQFAVTLNTVLNQEHGAAAAFGFLWPVTRIWIVCTPGPSPS